MVKVPEEAFDAGVLDRDYHARLIAGLPKWAGKAGIPMEFVWTKLSKYCSKEEIEWVKGMRQSKDHGLVYTGTFSVPIEDKMMAIAAACLRNYVDARFMSVQQVIARLKEDDMPECSVVLVPNFCMSKDDTSNVAPWEAAALLGWLYSRLARGQKTVLYVGDMKKLEAAYGESMARHIKSHYTIV